MLPSCSGRATGSQSCSCFLVHWATGQPKRAWAESVHQLGRNGRCWAMMVYFGRGGHSYFVLPKHTEWWYTEGKVLLSSVFTPFRYLCAWRRSYFHQSDVLSRKAHLSFPRYIMCLFALSVSTYICNLSTIVPVFGEHGFYFLTSFRAPTKYRPLTIRLRDLISFRSFIIASVKWDAISNTKFRWLALMSVAFDTALCS